MTPTSGPPHDRDDRTLAQQLSGAFVSFGGLVIAAFLGTAAMYAVSRVWTCGSG